jgi:protein gp37/predicted NAD-dependent protein-ADP-ribosyltransferase YbiA (DUF1768 family)
MYLVPVSTYEGRKAVSVEVAWQYSRVYSHILQDKKLVPTNYAHPDGSPTPEWFAWRDYNWGRSEFRHTDPAFSENRAQIRRAFPEGSRSLWYWDGHMLDEVTARREIYARLYIESVQRTAAWQQLQTLFQQGDVRIFDFDGYDDIALGMTPEQTLLNTDHDWGHGTLLAFLLRGVDPLKLGPPSVRTKVRDHMSPRPLPKDAILLKKSEDPFGWMNNMNNRYPVEADGVQYPSTEHLFLALRFPGDAKFRAQILATKSGLILKRWVRSRVQKSEVKPVSLRDAADIERMRWVLGLKLNQHPELVAALLATGSRLIAEDCSARPEEREIDGSVVAVPFWGIRVEGGKAYVGENTLGTLWMEWREALRKDGFRTIVSPQGDTLRVETGAVTSVDPDLLDGVWTAADAAELLKQEKQLASGLSAVTTGFQQMVLAMAEIFARKLYRVDGQTFAEYFQNRWGMARAHAYRLVDCGRRMRALAASASPLAAEFTSQAHFRPLIGSVPEKVVTAALTRLETWRSAAPGLSVTPPLVEAAVDLCFDFKDQLSAAPSGSKKKEPEPRAPKVSLDSVVKLVKEAQKKGGPKAWQQLLSDVQTLGRPRTTSINWAEKSWNPLVGCSKISAGCQYCYAAKFIGTRLKGVYPGIANCNRERRKQSPFNFTGQIRLAPEALNEPLKAKIGCRYFVNSLSDLFHKDVPEWFIDDVFDVMEHANWHTFQVLTKRPARMAAYTAKRYAKKSPHPHIWLGASIETQETHKLRIADLGRVRTAVRWISAEPCLGPIKFNLKGIHWLVLGGESGSRRKMEKTWVVDILKQCQAHGVPFFFKQWGYYGEDGKVKKRVIYADGKKPKKKPAETIDGKSYESLPPALLPDA